LKTKGGILFFFVFQWLSFRVFAQDLPVEINADSINYDREKGVVTGTGNVVLTYQDTTLIADRGLVNLKTKEARAEGHVQIVQQTRRLAGDALYYNFDTGRGEFTNAIAFYEPWYAQGHKVTRFSKEKYFVDKGYVTTCDYPDPHYRLKASKIDIYPGQKLVARNVIFFIGKVPVFWFPYYSHSLRDRKSRWSFIPGYSKRWGAYLLSSFDWLQTEYVDSRVRLDYREKRGVGVGLDGEYRFKKRGGGKFKTYYIRDKERTLDDGTVVEEDRYRASLSHYQPWKYQTTLRGQFHKLSDEDVLLDFFYRDSDYNTRPSSFFDITKYHPKYIARFYVQKRVNDFYTEVERLPEASLEFRRQRIFKTPFYYTSLNSIANLAKKFADPTLIEIPGQDTGITVDSLESVRFDTYDEISYPKKYFGWLETNIYTGVRQTWYSKELKEGESIWRGAFSGGAEVGTKIYRIWDYEDKKWDLHTLRHVIEPRIKYTYIHDPTVPKERLIQFDQIDALVGQNTIRPSVRNKLQTKRNNQVWDLVDFLLFVDYFVEADKDPLGNPDQNSFSDIFGDLELRPFHNFSLDLDFSFDQYEGRVSSFNTDIATFKEGEWRVATGVRFLDQQSTQWTWAVDYMINSDWTVKAYNRWEFETSELQDQQYTISRDLHCWNSAFTFRKTGEDVQFWITFWLKAYPDFTVDVGN
jgi:LPS-assembly protein